MTAVTFEIGADDSGSVHSDPISEGDPNFSPGAPLTPTSSGASGSLRNVSSFDVSDSIPKVSSLREIRSKISIPWLGHRRSSSLLRGLKLPSRPGSRQSQRSSLSHRISPEGRASTDTIRGLDASTPSPPIPEEPSESELFARSIMGTHYAYQLERYVATGVEAERKRLWEDWRGAYDKYLGEYPNTNNSADGAIEVMASREGKGLRDRFRDRLQHGDILPGGEADGDGNEPESQLRELMDFEEASEDWNHEGMSSHHVQYTNLI